VRHGKLHQIIRHGRPRPRYVTAASWLAVSAFGLAVGTLGVGGLMDLFGGKGVGSEAVAASGPLPALVGLPALVQNGPTGSARTRLQDARVVAPDEIPNGLALTGGAPSALAAKARDYSPFVPTSMRLPSGRLAPIVPVSVHSDGSLEIPADPDRVGWWTGGAQAGEPYGGIVLAGHVDSAQYGIGVLAEMLTMRPGQELKLADGLHGQRYRIETVVKLPKAELAAGTDLFDQNLKHRLVMITCGGPFDRKTHRYRDNVVLVATPVS
jgi:Sortase domain